MPPKASNLRSNIKFKSPMRIGYRLSTLWLDKWSLREFNVLIWSFSVFALYKLIREFFLDSYVKSTINILPCLSQVDFSISMSKSFVKPIKTPRELLKPWEKNSFPDQSLRQSSSHDLSEWDSWIAKTPLFSNLPLR